jgi:ribosomal protein S18 acetylase RimI-like enzyme
VTRRLAATDGPEFRRITLERMRSSPEGTFGGSLSELTVRTPSEWDDLVAEHAAAPLPTTFVLERGPSFVGCATVSIAGDGLPALSGIYVASDLRGAGLGRSLVQTALEWAHTHAPDRPVQLWVAPGNENAIGLYRSLGFEPTGRVWESTAAGWLEMQLAIS